MAHPEEPTLPEDTGQRKNKNMEELMKMIVRRTALAVCTLVLAVILPTAASAACTGFDDVPESADCYESVMYLAKCEIVAGMGNECFSPEHKTFGANLAYDLQKLRYTLYPSMKQSIHESVPPRPLTD